MSSYMNKLQLFDVSQDVGQLFDVSQGVTVRQKFVFDSKLFSFHLDIFYFKFNT